MNSTYSDSIKCPKCQETINLKKSARTNQNYYAHHQNQTNGDYNEPVKCNFFSWASEWSNSHEEKFRFLKVFISSERNYFKDFNIQNSSSMIDQQFINRIVTNLSGNHVIEKSNLKLIQTGRILPQLKYSQDQHENQKVEQKIIITPKPVNTHNYDHHYHHQSSFIEELIETENKKFLHEYNNNLLTRSLPMIINKQIQQSDFIYAVFTRENEIQVVAEIHSAIALSIPVYLKFSNCNKYNFREIYKYTINAVFDHMTSRRSYFNPKYFKENAILNNYWNCENDYLNYLYFLPVCLYCDQTCSKTSNNSKSKYSSESSAVPVSKSNQSCPSFNLLNLSNFENFELDFELEKMIEDMGVGDGDEDGDGNGDDFHIFNKFDDKYNQDINETIKTKIKNDDSELESDFINYDDKSDEGHGNKLICLSCFEKIEKILIPLLPFRFTSQLTSILTTLPKFPRFQREDVTHLIFQYLH